jgi:hypothetical protein
MLITLSYRLPREHAGQVLGTATAYPLTEDFSAAWEAVRAARNGRQPRYSWLATGLCAASGQPVRLFGERDLTQGELDAGSRMLLLTSRPFDYRLGVSVTAWERCITADDYRNTLAPLLPDPEPGRLLADYVTYRSGATPEAPNWVFRVATSQLMTRLAAAPLLIDGRGPLALRLDTDGSLLAWEADDLITSAAKNGTASGLARITARLVTSPGTGDLIVCFSAHLSRIAGTWAKVKNTWIARNAPGAPVLRLPVRHELRRGADRRLAESWRHLLHQEIPAIIEACELEPITLPDSMPPVLGSVRPQFPGGMWHPLGTGLGARFMLRLHEHISACLPELTPIGLEPDKSIKLAKRSPRPGLGDTAIAATGYQRLIIACLYSTPGARDRMLAALEELTGQPLATLPDGQPQAVSGTLSVVALHCPELLAHGTPGRYSRLNLLLAHPGLARGRDDLLCAWLETEYHAEVPIADGDDAKPHLRRLLANRQVPSQFLATPPLQLPKRARPSTDAAKEHAARSALYDLLRNAGFLDDRIPQAVTTPGLRHRLDRPALLVGIHARRQQADTDDRPLVLVLAAIHATPDPSVPWRTLLYSERHRRWLRSAEALTGFQAGSIGDSALGRTEEKAARTRDRVEERLIQLTQDHPGLPLVIFTDGPATRTIWPGLQDHHFGTGALPGDSLRADGHDVAVVRSNHGDEIGRPVSRKEEGRLPPDPRQPAAPGRTVYRRTDTTEPVWLFAGASRTYLAKGGPTGAKHTRWTLPDKLASEIRKPWHSYTGTEIAVPHAGTWDPATLAALTARLCEQPVFWEGRVVCPTPLHLAISADKDHPDYRTATSQPEDEGDAAEDLGLSEDEDEASWADANDELDVADPVTDHVEILLPQGAQ